MVQGPADDRSKERVAEIRNRIGLSLRQFYDEELKKPMSLQIIELLREFDQRLNGIATSSGEAHRAPT